MDRSRAIEDLLTSRGVDGAALRRFVTRSFGRPIADHINWNGSDQAVRFDCCDFLDRSGLLDGVAFTRLWEERLAEWAEVREAAASCGIELPVDPPATPQAPQDPSRRVSVVVEIPSLKPEQLGALYHALREFSGDARVTLADVLPGSVIVVLAGPQSALARLVAAGPAGVTRAVGMEVSRVYWGVSLFARLRRLLRLGTAPTVVLLVLLLLGAVGAGAAAAAMLRDWNHPDPDGAGTLPGPDPRGGNPAEPASTEPAAPTRIIPVDPPDPIPSSGPVEGVAPDGAGTSAVADPSPRGSEPDQPRSNPPPPSAPSETPRSADPRSEDAAPDNTPVVPVSAEGGKAEPALVASARIIRPMTRIGTAGTGSSSPYWVVVVTGSGSTNSEVSAPLDYEWRFSDGGTAKGPTVVHTFTSHVSLNQSVALRVRGPDGAEATTTLDLTLPNEPPVARLDDRRGCDVSVGQTIRVGERGSKDPDGDPVTFTWKLARATPTTLTGTTARAPTGLSKLPKLPATAVVDATLDVGTYRFTLTAQDRHGAVSKPASITCRVLDGPF